MKGDTSTGLQYYERGGARRGEERGQLEFKFDSLTAAPIRRGEVNS